MNPQEETNLQLLAIEVRHLSDRVRSLEGSWVKQADFEMFRQEYQDDRRFLRNVFSTLLFVVTGGFATVLWLLIQKGM